ncbi:MAG: hypothetical protein KJ709_00490 [Nanoarchaeota archaeon]|nr:hypothetical protein [Nanoarchaeota archaeon]
MAVGRRGVIFTFISITVLFFTITFIYNTSQYRLRDNIFLAESRIIALDRFISDTESDLERALYIAAFRTLLAMNPQDAADDYITDIDDKFHEMMIYGNLDGQPRALINDSNILLWTEKMEAQGSKLSILFSLTPLNIDVHMVSPWDVEVELDSTLEVEDIGGAAKWVRNITTRTKVNIINFPDPVYGHGGAQPNIIKESVYTIEEIRTNDDKLKEHWESQRYLPCPGAPDYIQRLGGQLGGKSEYGIESLAFPSNYLPGPDIKNKSMVDHIYWSSANPIHCPVDVIPSLRMDNTEITVGVVGRWDFYDVNVDDARCST